MADQPGAYPRGTVTRVYLTSDGGLTLENSFLALARLLPAHAEWVSTDTAARLALAARRPRAWRLARSTPRRRRGLRCYESSRMTTTTFVVARRSLTGALFGVLVARGAAAQPTATEAPRAVAEALMAMPLESFHATRARRPPPFDWSSNGCNFGEVTGPFHALFNRACDRHDFGYRNFGGSGLQLDRSEARRLRIDQRLHTDLEDLCAHSYADTPPRTACRAAAASVYATVIGAGSPWFHDVVPLPGSLPTVAAMQGVPAALPATLRRVPSALRRIPVPSLPRALRLR